MRIPRLLAALVLWCAAASCAAAAPLAFPPLTGRVVDQAGILSPATEAALTAKLAALEQTNQRQLVVATVPSLQGQTIEDYGYQLGRAWGIGQKLPDKPGGEHDNGVILLVAPNDRAVRIEVGYGLEGVLTDAFSSTIIQGAILPRFKAGDMDGGVTAGTDALVQQLGLPDGEAQARVAQAAQTAADDGDRSGPFGIIFLIFLAVLFLSRGFGRRRGILPWIILGGLSGGGGRGGGWGGGGGGFSGGGGSFGGGGASGRW